MRNNFLATPSKKAPTVYQAIDEEQEDSSWTSQRAELRDDDVPDSHFENRPPPITQETNNKEHDDDLRRSTVSPRVKLLLNREFVFQSSKMTFYNSPEMRLASPKTEFPHMVDGQNNKPPSLLRPPSFAEAPREEINVQKEDQNVIAQKVAPNVQVHKVVQDVHIDNVVQDTKVLKVQNVVQDVNVQKVAQDVKVHKVVQDAKAAQVVKEVKVPKVDQKVGQAVKVQKVDQEVTAQKLFRNANVQDANVVQDVSDTMSVTSIFYDDYSTAHTRTGVEVDVVHEHEDYDDNATEMDGYSVGYSIFSRGRDVIHKTGSVETSFPEDPNKWLAAASSVVGEEHLLTAPTIESREVDRPTDSEDADSWLDQLDSQTIPDDVSHHNQPPQNQLVWQAHDETETLTENGSVFDKAKHTGRINCSPFDQCLDENEMHTDEQGNDDDIAIDQLFPSDPLWTIRCEMEKQEMVENANKQGSQNYDEAEDPFPKDPFFHHQRTPKAGHSVHDPNINLSPKRNDLKSTNAEYQGPFSFADVRNPDTREIRADDNKVPKSPTHVERNGNVGAKKNPFDRMAFNPFAGNHDDEEDDTTADYGYSRDEESCVVDHNDYQSQHGHDDNNNNGIMRHEVPLDKVTNPFESYDDDSLLYLESNSKDTKDSDDYIVKTQKTVTNYINPFDDISTNEPEDSGDNKNDATKTNGNPYINPFDDSQDDGYPIGEKETKGGVKKSTNPFDTFDDDMSLDRNMNPPSDPVNYDQLVTVVNDMNKTPSKEDHETSPTSSLKNGVKATNLYTMVMMHSGAATTNDSDTKTTMADQTVLPHSQDTLDSKVERKTEQKSGNNSKRSAARSVLSPSDMDNPPVEVDDIFHQALLPPSTQEGPQVDSDEDDCYIEDDDDDEAHGEDEDSDLSDSSDQYEDGVIVDDAEYNDGQCNDGHGEYWQTHLYASSSEARNQHDLSVQRGATVGGNPNDVHGPSKQSYHPPTKNQVIVTRKLDYDEASMESDRDAYDAFMRDTGKHNQYDSTVSVGESDQQTCFDEEAHPDSEALSCFDDDQEDDDTQTLGDDGTVGGLKVLGCLHCSALEEEMMILKAQHQTELLERDLQDEEVLNNMMLMREYIENLESDQSVTRLSLSQFPEPRSRSCSITEVELEKSFSELSKDRDERSTNFQLFELKARVRFLEDENRRLKDEQTSSDTTDTQALMDRIREMENEREENQKVLAMNDMMKSRIQELEAELEKSKAETNQELKRRIRDLEAKLDLSRQEARDDFKHQIEELEEERDLLYTKIEAQEASVALMTEEEAELRKLVHRLENELQLVKLERESETMS